MKLDKMNTELVYKKTYYNISITTTGTLDVSGGTLTTSTTQNDAIVDGSTAITRSSNDLTFAGNMIPSEHNTYSIGSGSKRIKEIYLSNKKLINKRKNRECSHSVIKNFKNFRFFIT